MFAAKTTLAEYRSALQTTSYRLPPNPSKAAFGITAPFLVIDGFAVDLRGQSSEAFVLGPPLRPSLANGITIKVDLSY